MRFVAGGSAWGFLQRNRFHHHHCQPFSIAVFLVSFPRKQQTFPLCSRRKMVPSLADVYGHATQQRH